MTRLRPVRTYRRRPTPKQALGTLTLWLPPLPPPSRGVLTRAHVPGSRADDRLYLFMECMYGGELFDRIVDMGHFTEKMAQDVCYKL